MEHLNSIHWSWGNYGNNKLGIDFFQKISHLLALWP